MKGYIDGIDFHNIDAMKYYAPPASWTPEKKKDLITNRIFSGQWYGARKRDGAFYKFVKDEDGNMELIGRSKSVSGDYLNKIDWVPHLHDFFDEIDNGTVFLGELYLPSKEEAKATTAIMNCLVDKAVKRQESEETKLHYYIFDILAENGKSYLDMKAKDRFAILNEFHRAYGEKYWHWANYHCGQELWDTLQETLAEGGEGVVIINEDSPYRPGKRSTKDSLKIKKELEERIDCVVMGANPPTKLYNGKEIESWPYWYNELTGEKLKGDYFRNYQMGEPIVPITKPWFYGWAGSLKLGVYDNGKLVHIGNVSGITDDMKENWKDHLNTVVEISVMEIMTNEDGSKGLRHPKYIRSRQDKEPKECSIEQLI